jgi:hypothetical protein
MIQTDSASTIQLLGAAGFGALIGWYVYYINRYRKSEVSLNDIVTLIGVLGGGTVLAIFPERTDLFGAYGIGLFIGFFSYFILLLLWVAISKNFTVEWFLDGRRKRPVEPFFIPEDKVGGTAMAMPKEEGGKTTTND